MSNTSRARALAKELRAARQDVGLSMKLVGQQLGWSEAKVSRVENAKQGIKEADVSAMLAVLRVTGVDRERLLKMAREIDQPAWWELGRSLPEQLTALIDAEQRAVRITDVTLNLVPGLLQTRAYTRAVMESSGMSADEADALISVRQVRQGILSSSDPTTLRCLIDESALIRPIGGPRVMAEQLRRIVAAGREPNISVQVLPLELGAHAGLAGTFVLLEFVKSRDVIYLEARSSGAFIDEPDDVALFTDAVARVEQLAFSPTGSAEILAKYIHKYESEAT
ncbi:helix-turn-helix transcriptional regulator [Saccharopolyspora sp. NFXS83]|uniref:helix-turn-helix domain-containing protein n=1 Tax=Saccharopolyspora sp. NFXS83 TaxID=2993560 RepID=UPI00224B15E2|nr:helix-turn-helix transcriptional regulator [Saccharopolyspora sp. NFXS83]MCX2733225.1 helix-turn-helix transcriptional regulator [Saccharopolyspora sp. NFXS83]